MRVCAGGGREAMQCLCENSPEIIETKKEKDQNNANSRWRLRRFALEIALKNKRTKQETQWRGAATNTGLWMGAVPGTQKGSRTSCDVLCGCRSVR